MSASRLLASILALSVLSCSQSSPDEGDFWGKGDDLAAEVPAKTPTRIIWMIGDGMGPGQVTAAAYAAGEPLHMLTMPDFGVMATHEHEFVTTDSGASASAMASGHKTHFEGISIAPGTEAADETERSLHPETVLDVAQRVEWRTGIVATTSVVDATPAAFIAHRASRRSKDEIALDLSESGVDVVIGGGSQFFNDRSDGADLIARMRSDGYSVSQTATGLKRAAGKKKKILALLADKDMPEVLTGERLMGLPDMTAQAIEALDFDNDDGFFLMVEGSWIDRKSHELDGAATIAEAREFDDAVGVALDYARSRDDVLVIVTADHETGGLSVLDPQAAEPYVTALGGVADANRAAAFGSSFGPDAVAHLPLGTGTLGPVDAVDPRMTPAYGYLSLASRPFFSGPGFVYKATHSATFVPVFAEGVASDWVTDTRDNANLGKRVKALIGEDGADGAEPSRDALEPTNVIVVVTDGIGLPTLAAGQYGAGELGSLSAPVFGLTATHATDRLVNGQGGAATALFSGEPALSAAVGSEFFSLFELAESAGRKTALVTTGSPADDAVAAGFTVSADDDRSVAIAEFSPSTDGLDLLFAGGRAQFTDTQIDDWKARGARVRDTWTNRSDKLDAPLIRLFADGSLDSASARLADGADHPPLSEMVDTALRSLDRSGEPFFAAVVATGARDTATASATDMSVVDEVVDVDRALRVALQFAAGRDDTLVVAISLRDSTLSVLDNHYGFHKGHCGVAMRCGGPVPMVQLPVAVDRVPNALGFLDRDMQGDFADIGILLQYSWLSHHSNLQHGTAGAASANFTPRFAAGAGSERFSGFLELSTIGAVLSDFVSQ